MRWRTLATIFAFVLAMAGCGGGGGGDASPPTTNPTVNTDAVAFQITPSHTGAVTFQSVTLPTGSLWSVTLDEPPSYALIAGGLIYVTVTISAQGAAVSSQLLALDQATGATAWGPVAIAAPAVSAAYDDGRIYVIGSSGLVQAFEASSGNLVWSTMLTGQTAFGSGITALNGYLYTSGSGGALAGGLYALSESTGAIAWTQPVEYGSGGTPAVTSSGVYVAYPCHSYDFNPASGAPIWSTAGPCTGGGGGTPVVANGIAYMPLSLPPSGNLTPSSNAAYNAITGANVSTYLADNPPAIGSASGYFLQSGVLRGISLNSATVLWSFTGDSFLATSPILVNNYVFIGSQIGNLYAVDATSGAQVWQMKLNGEIPPVVVENGIPLVGMSAGNGLLIVPSGYSTITAFQLSTNP